MNATSLLLAGLLTGLLPASAAVVADDEGEIVADESASKVQIDWGTAILEQTIRLSDGNSLTIAEFTIEVGAFRPGFVPAIDNVDEWLANWNVFDAVTPGDSDPRDFAVSSSESQARFAGSANLVQGGLSDSEDAGAQNPGFAFESDEQGYIFLRNSDTPGDGAEWALLTNLSGSGPVASEPWVFPAVGAGQPQFSANWFLSSVDTAVVGAVHGGDPAGGVTGEGEFSDASSDFVIRTHSIVPEPSVPILLGVVALSVLVRRRS